jgi:hypothetical protein
MAEPGDDKISGAPGSMTAANIQGPRRFNPTVDLMPGMAEGIAFAKVDNWATKELKKFMFTATRDFETYSRQARDSGYNYLDADEFGAQAIKDVTDSETTHYYA